jgi:hypothetical protein
MNAAASLNLTVHHLRFECEALTPVHLGPQAGAQIRGALWQALQSFACTDPSAATRPEHARHCPMCRLVALETADAARGLNPARPFAIQPPLAMRAEADRYYRLGERFQFGISLFGDASDLFPYILQAVNRMGDQGIGYGRGQFRLLQAYAFNPLLRAKQSLLEQGRVVVRPGVPITNAVIQEALHHSSPTRLKLRFLTPTQLVADHHFSDIPQFDILIARLLERCQSIEQYYTEMPTPSEHWRERHLLLSTEARNVHIVENRTHWVRARSGSRRSNVSTPVGGLVGEVAYEGELSPFLEWIYWGQSLHVGKNAVKGCGWYEIVR